MKVTFSKVGWACSRKGNNELWLEFGNIQRQSNNWHDVHWYNEGNGKEIGYWLKNLLKDLFRKDRYYLIRYAGISFYVKN